MEIRNPRKQLWEVVGGLTRGGLLVRSGESTSSQEFDERLLHGSWVQQEQLQGHRLLYTLVEGKGPFSGWVSVRVQQQDLLLPRQGPPDGLWPAAIDQDAAPTTRLGVSAAELRREQAAVVLQQHEVLAAVCENLTLPLEGMPIIRVCRNWRVFLNACTAAWARLRLERREDLSVLGPLLLRTGTQLRVLDVSKAGGRGLGARPELALSLQSCPTLEELNVTSWAELSFAAAPNLLRQLAGSLKRLKMRGCAALHAQLPAMLGPQLQHLEAGWLDENDPDRVASQWASIFPSHVFRTISGQCPELTRLVFPGYALYTGQSERVVQGLLQEYADIGGLGSLRQLRRLNLSCAQLLEDAAMIRIAQGCRSLRTLGLRCCFNLTDRSIQVITQSLGNTLAHINISCCQFSERAVKRLLFACRGLRTLDLCYCKGLGPGLMTYLCMDPHLCPQLRMIGAGGLDVSDAEVKVMCEKYAGSLEHLGIGSAVVTDSGLELLAGLPHLKRLSAHQLRGVSAAGLTRLCLSSPSLRDVDADQCEYVPDPSAEELQSLERCLADRPYDYSLSDEDSDNEEAERARLKREREERERAEKERQRKKAGDPQRVLLAMEMEMQTPK